MNKICNKCGIEKDINDFYKGNAKCKKCKIDYQKEFANSNKDKIKEYKHKYHVNNLDSEKEKRKENYNLNKEKRREKSAEYYSLNKEAKFKYQKDRKKIDNLYKLGCVTRTMLANSLKRGGYTKKSHTYEIIGCSYEFLLGYLEAKFESWMNWENKGLYNSELNYGWDIDHIIPLSSAINEEDLLKLNHYSNLQPLCSKVNRDIKKDKL